MCVNNTSSPNWNKTGNNGVRRIFKIPVGGLNPEKAKEELTKLIADYKQDINLDVAGHISNSTFTCEPEVIELNIPERKSFSGIISQWIKKIFTSGKS